ncbi:MAG: (Fe-S)-binding protein [Bacteroidales bacterium]|nr:(Fe-S)-binding protein [Bacteroidales bacterium]
MISQVIFLLLLLAAIYLFTINVKKIIRNINRGRDIKINDNKKQRWWLMFKVAIGQSKMTARPVSGIMHIFVYAGFLIVNVEMLEILIDGVFGTHRLFAFTGNFYNILVSIFEFFAFAVLFGCLIFLIRRNIIRLKRFWSNEMTSWPRTDANIILITEILLMSAVLTMNATDSILQSRGIEHYVVVGNFAISSFIQPLFINLPDSTLMFIERFCWWFHIVGVFAFLNYIPYSKHFHVFLAFPNVYYSKLRPKTEIENMPSITKEVKLMLDPNAAIPENEPATGQFPFGVKDIKDLTWKNIMDAYTCTECGRCTDVCPANITGKKLSPRKIMMDIRDHVNIVGKDTIKKKDTLDEGKSLFDYITPEELWACTTCNACTNECPVNIDHVSVILNMRRYLVMEQAAGPGELNTIFTNIENNGAPWQFSPQDRLNWANNLEMNIKNS